MTSSFIHADDNDTVSWATPWAHLFKKRSLSAVKELRLPLFFAPRAPLMADLLRRSRRVAGLPAEEPRLSQLPTKSSTAAEIVDLRSPSRRVSSPPLPDRDPSPVPETPTLSGHPSAISQAASVLPPRPFTFEPPPPVTTWPGDTYQSVDHHDPPRRLPRFANTVNTIHTQRLNPNQQRLITDLFVAEPRQQLPITSASDPSSAMATTDAMRSASSVTASPSNGQPSDLNERLATDPVVNLEPDSPITREIRRLDQEEQETTTPLDTGLQTRSTSVADYTPLPGPNGDAAPAVFVQAPPIQEAPIAYPAPESITPKPKECAVCEAVEGQDTTKLYQPCVACESRYCRECVSEMFERAITEAGAMPPKCCRMIQIHVGINKLAPYEFQTFKAKFEEWLSSDKVYCPVPGCSAFIPERFYAPSHIEPPNLGDIFKDRLVGLVQAVRHHLIPGNPEILSRGADGKFHDMTASFNTFSEQTARGKFKSLAEFMAELDRICRHSTMSRHQAQRLREVIYKQLQAIDVDISDEQARARSLPQLLACPKCSIAICNDCKQKAHVGKPCDTTQKDYEAALLVQYRYKQCPNCKTAVKRMFGCSHMECHCGCHWCWGCARPINECGGGCDEGEYSDEDDGEGYSDEEDDLPAQDSGTPVDVDQVGMESPESGRRAQVLTAPPIRATRSPADDLGHLAAPPPATAQQTGVVQPPDLDAGGGARWANGDRFFGEEPAESSFQVIGCFHSLKTVYDRGGHDKTIDKNTRLICNRCFKEMRPLCKPPSISSNQASHPFRGRPGPDIGPHRPAHAGAAFIYRTITDEPWVSKSNGVEKPKTSTETRPPADVPSSCKSCNILYCGACADFIRRKDLARG